MKATRLTNALAVSGFLGLASLGHAVVVSLSSPDTYIFTAAPGYTTAFNGSTLTIATVTGGGGNFIGDDITAYNFIDTDLNPTTYGSDNVYSPITSYDTTGWVGEFVLDVGSGVTFDATGTSMDEYSGDTAVAGGDPPGTWTMVPDASSTFPLLLGILAAVVGYHQCNRQQILASARR